MDEGMTAEDIGDHEVYQRAPEAGATAAAGANKLVQLHSLLDKPWFRDRHSVRFELQTMGNGLTLLIVRPDNQQIASWTARGDSMVFATTGGTEVRAEILDCAVSITCEFLDQTRTRRH
jgi:hypothetical protein